MFAQFAKFVVVLLNFPLDKYHFEPIDWPSTVVRVKAFSLDFPIIGFFAVNLQNRQQQAGEKKRQKNNENVGYFFILYLHLFSLMAS